MSKGGKDSPCLSLLPLGPRFMAFSPLSGNKRAIWRRKDFISIPSYLTSSWAVVSSSFCWAVWGCTQEEEEARGHSVLMALRLWEKLWIGITDDKTWGIPEDSSTILTPRTTKTQPSCQDTGNQIQSVGGDDSKEAGRSDTQGPAKNYTLWEPTNCVAERSGHWVWELESEGPHAISSSVTNFWEDPK